MIALTNIFDYHTLQNDERIESNGPNCLGQHRDNDEADDEEGQC